MNFLINFLFRRLSVDSIVASFDKTIAKLETVQARQQEKRDRETDRIERAHAKREKHEQEMRRAIQTADRFKRLVRGDEPKSEVASADFAIQTADSGLIRGFGLDEVRYGK